MPPGPPPSNTVAECGEFSTTLLPMFTELRINSDSGKPHANFEQNTVLRAALEHIVGALAGEVSKRNMQPAVSLTVE